MPLLRQFVRIGLYLLCLALAVGASAAQATLIPVQSTFGPGSLIRDTETGLEWLNLRQTVNLSYSDVQAALQSGGRFAGFRYATVSELSSAFNHYFAQLPQLPQPSASSIETYLRQRYIQYAGLANLFGPTEVSNIETGTPIFRLLGYLQPGYGGGIGIADVQANPNNSFIDTQAVTLTDRRSPIVGHFLVRGAAAVAEPAALLVLGSGLAGLAVLAGRRHRAREGCTGTALRAARPRRGTDLPRSG